MRYSPSRARRAFTMVEVLVAIVILGIIGGALVKLLMSQSRFTERQMERRNARTVSRNAMNIMLTDLRMVQDKDGLMAAGRGPIGADGVAHDSVVVRTPIAFGLYCSANGSGAVLSLLPVDTSLYSLGVYGGWAVRDSASGTYSYSNASPPAPFSSITANFSPNSIFCNGPGISQVTYYGSAGNPTTGKVFSVLEAPTGPVGPGWPIFVFEQVTYIFQPSISFTGRIGLFRKIRTGLGNTTGDFKTDEIIAPFDTSAGFRYYVLNNDTSQVSPPADLNAVRGLQLYLAGSSPRVPASEQAAQAALVTGVFFKNRRDP